MESKKTRKAKRAYVMAGRQHAKKKRKAKAKKAYGKASNALNYLTHKAFGGERT